ncbi:hypothetical protein SNEBB_006960 [Seison nebaliae]|nr:hypothetical protein SNEBB_006960 [Seison nebaliae]
MKNYTASFLGISFHVVHHGSLKTGLFGFEKFIGRHTSQNIRHILNNCIEKNNITADKISFYVTDGGSNVRGVFRSISKRNHLMSVEHSMDELPRRSARKIISNFETDFIYDFNSINGEGLDNSVENEENDDYEIDKDYEIDEDLVIEGEDELFEEDIDFIDFEKKKSFR